MTIKDSDHTGKVEILTDSQPRDVDSRAFASTATAKVLWITIPFVLIVGAGFIYWNSLLSSGVDRDWALGKSNWATPPGTMLAGYEIGGKPVDNLDETFNQLSEGFETLSVWLVESPLIPSVVAGDFQLSTVFDEVAISVTPSDLGLSIDMEAMRIEIDAVDSTNGDFLAMADRVRIWNNPPSLPIRLAFDFDLTNVYLESVKSTVDCEPVNAVLDLANRIVITARDGMEVDIEATLTNFPSFIPEINDIPVELVVSRTEPEITNDAFSNFDLETPLGEYTTSFSIWKRNRSRNISLVAAHFEGVVIQPGEIFSFNETTGPRTLAEGYLLAPMYRNRRPELSPAGGACQVSTTLYNSALLAGMEIIARWPHSRPCGYVPYGLDATVAFESGVDLSFRNTLDHPVILHQTVDYLEAGTITFEIFGHPDDRVYVELGNAYSWIGRTEEMATYILDETLEIGEEVVEDEGVNGLNQRAWRVWFDVEGIELYTEELSTDRVRPVGALIRHNPPPEIPEGPGSILDILLEEFAEDTEEDPDEEDPDKPPPSEPPPPVEPEPGSF